MKDGTVKDGTVKDAAGGRERESLHYPPVAYTNIKLSPIPIASILNAFTSSSIS